MACTIKFSRAEDASDPCPDALRSRRRLSAACRARSRTRYGDARLLCATCEILLRPALLRKVIHRVTMLRAVICALYLHPIYFALLQNVTNRPPQSGRKSAVMSVIGNFDERIDIKTSSLNKLIYERISLYDPSAGHNERDAIDI